MSTGNPQLDRTISEMARTIGKLQSRIAQVERGQRTTQLDSSSVDGGSITINDENGDPQIMIGLQDDGTYAVVSQTGAPAGPPTPDDPQVVSSALGLTVVWDGLIGATAPPANFAGVQVHCSTSPVYTPDASTLQGVMTAAGLFAIPNLIPGTTYYVCLVALDTAGNLGTESDFISCVAGQLSGSFILPGSVNAADVVMQGSVVASNLYISYAAQVFQDNPLAWWRLDDAPGAATAADSGPTGFPGAATAVTFGNQNIAADAMPTASFNPASSQVVSTYQPGAFSALTVEIWANFNGQAQTSAFPQIFSSSDTSGTNEGFQLYTNGTSAVNPTINLGNGTTWAGYSMGAALPASGWVHLVMTYDGANVTCYQNGVQVSQTARTGTIAADVTRFVSMSVTQRYAGLLSNAAIYGTALSAQRVQAHYNARQGSIIADNIAADTITATHILAGTVVAGIVNGTLIEGGEFLAVNSHGAILWHLLPNGNEFWYHDTGSATQGRLVQSVAAVAGTDSFGNSYLAGHAWYHDTGTGYLAVVLADAGSTGSTISWYSSATYGGGYTNRSSMYSDASGFFSIGAGAVINIQTGVAQVQLVNSSGVLFLNGTQVQVNGTGGSFVSQVPAFLQAGVTINGAASVSGNLQAGTETVLGALTALGGTAANPTLITTDGWHSLGSLPVSGITTQVARYLLLPDGDVEIDIHFSSTGTVATFGGTAFPNTLPAAYQPTHNVLCAIAGSGTSWTISGSRLPNCLVTPGGAVQISMPAINAAIGDMGCTFRFPTT